MKAIKGHENYLIDEAGNIFSKKSNKFLKPYKQKNGYLKNSLCENGVNKYFYVHRLVAESFIPNPENWQEVDHIDRNPQNNNVFNLRWVSSYQNNTNKVRKQIKLMETLENGVLVFFPSLNSVNDIAQQTLSDRVKKSNKFVSKGRSFKVVG